MSNSSSACSYWQNGLLLSSLFPPSYLLPGEPAGFLNLILVHLDVSGHCDAEASNHEVGGHGPGLTGHVVHRAHLHAALLLHLPPHCILDGLTCGEAGGHLLLVSMNHPSFLCVCVCMCVTYLALWIQPDRRTCPWERPSSFPANTGFHQGGSPAWWPLGLDASDK